MITARENPFRSSQLEQLRFRFDNDSWPDLRSRLKSANHRAAIVGPHGTGKTTLLLELRDLLIKEGRELVHLQLSDDLPRFDSKQLAEFRNRLNPNHVILVDSCERLSWIGWRRFKSATANAGGLIITAHNHGRLPTLLETRPSVDLLDDLVKDLLGLPQATQATQAGLIPALLARHSGNIREALRELYDLHATNGGSLETVTEARGIKNIRESR